MDYNLDFFIFIKDEKAFKTTSKCFSNFLEFLFC